MRTDDRTFYIFMFLLILAAGEIFYRVQNLLVPFNPPMDPRHRCLCTKELRKLCIANVWLPNPFGIGNTTATPGGDSGTQQDRHKASDDRHIQIKSTSKWSFCEHFVFLNKKVKLNKINIDNSFIIWTIYMPQYSAFIVDTQTNQF